MNTHQKKLFRMLKPGEPVSRTQFNHESGKQGLSPNQRDTALKWLIDNRAVDEVGVNKDIRRRTTAELTALVDHQISTTGKS